LFREEKGEKTLFTKGLYQIPGKFSSGVDLRRPGLDNPLGGFFGGSPDHLSLFFYIFHFAFIWEPSGGDVV
jgi:hypothetical protein